MVHNILSADVYNSIRYTYTRVPRSLPHAANRQISSIVVYPSLRDISVHHCFAHCIHIHNMIMSVSRSCGVPTGGVTRAKRLRIATVGIKLLRNLFATRWKKKRKRAKKVSLPSSLGGSSKRKYKRLL